MTEKKSYSELFGADNGESQSGDHQEQSAAPQGPVNSDTGVQGPGPAREQMNGEQASRSRTVISGYEETRFEERKILTIRDLLYIFFKHIRSIVVITAICLVTATVYSFSVTPLFRAETKILVKLGREGLSDLNEYSRNINILYQKRNQDVNNELEVFKGDELSRMVYEDLKEHLQDDGSAKPSFISRIFTSVKARLVGKPLSREEIIILFLRNSLRVEFLAETDILKLSFSSANPEFAAIAANAYADAFIRLRTKIYETTKSYRFYIDQIKIYQDKVDELVEQEKMFSRKWQISNIDAEKELILEERRIIEADYLLVKQDYNRLQILLNRLTDVFENSDEWVETPKMSNNEMVDRQAYLQDVDRQFFTLQLDRSRMSKKFTDSSREIRHLDASIKKLRGQKFLSLKNILDMTMQVKEKEIEVFEAELARKNKRLNELIQATYVLQQILIEKDIALKTLVNYSNKAENLRIYDDLDKNKITSLRTMNTALVPLQPYFPKKSLILITATFLGVFLSFGLSAIKEFFTHVFRDGQDVENILKVPLLMSISYKD
ncbi:MAG: hypothetical protein D6B25_16445 [Desulfobulbaceae bacterium]|nr:MAG: hypothetical protein D6B25_16445 [Desulfobulbaceae bacterium]